MSNRRHDAVTQSTAIVLGSPEGFGFSGRSKLIPPACYKLNLWAIKDSRRNRGRKNPTSLDLAARPSFPMPGGGDVPLHLRCALAEF